ncbi:hypothetical protein ACQYRI_17175 [Salmonella enterica]
MSHSYSHNHHHLPIAGNSAPLDVLNFDGHESLSQPSDYTIRFTCTDKAISLQSMLMQKAGFMLHDPKICGVLRTLRGMITDFARLSL